MDRISDKKKCMASLAVFRVLYNGKKDIYTIISEFIKLIIANKNIVHFELQEMIGWICTEYGFKLPEAVVKRATNRLNFLDKNRTQYTVTTQLNGNECQDIQNKLFEAQSENSHLIDSLLYYVKTKHANLLEKTNYEEELKKAFYSFVIDEKAVSPEYGAVISGFIVSINNDNRLTNQLNKIRQGMIIYVGLTYNTDYHVIDQMDMPLYIYFDTEILFSMAGYNGTLYQTLFDEFFDLALQINKRSHKAPIHFRYFTETKTEIDNYFSAAEDIVNHKQQLDPSKQAMTYIVSSCKSAFQVQEMLVDFYEKLKSCNILLDAQESYYDKENMQFSIEHNTALEELNNEYNEDDLLKKLRLLNYISIKRGSKSQKIFHNIGHILVSANKLTFKLSHHKSIRQAGCVPLATDLGFLTNRFWLLLNKGLSNEMNLHSFDIITKAQIALSTLVNDAVGVYYDELTKEMTAGEINTEELKRKIAVLRQLAIKPEDINQSNEDTYINVIDIDEIDRYIAEKQQEVERQLKDTEQLKGKITELESLNSQHEQKIQLMAYKLAEERNQVLKETYEQKKRKYDIRESNWIASEYKKEKHKCFTIVFLYSLVVVVLISCSFYDKAKWIGRISATVMIIIPFIRPLIDHTYIRKAYIFCFKKTAREQYKAKLKKEYRDMEPCPILEEVTIDDIIKELN